MPNWSDDEGRCHFMVGRVPCYQSDLGCPTHKTKQPKPKQRAAQPRLTRLTTGQYEEELRMREQTAYSADRKVAARMYAKAEMELREALYRETAARVECADYRLALKALVTFIEDDTCRHEEEKSEVLGEAQRLLRGK